MQMHLDPDKPVIPILDALEELDEDALDSQHGDPMEEELVDLFLSSPRSRIRLQPRRQSRPNKPDEHSSPQDLEEHADDVLDREERDRPLSFVDFQDPYSTPAPATQRRTAAPNQNDFPSFPKRPSPTGSVPAALTNALLAGDRMPQRAPALKLRRRMRPRVSRSPANNGPLAFPEAPGGFSLSSFPAQPRIVSPEATASR